MSRKHKFSSTRRMHMISCAVEHAERYEIAVVKLQRAIRRSGLLLSGFILL